MKRRVVIISDMHCGHRTGLTPSGWQYAPFSSPKRTGEYLRNKYSSIQSECWAWYESICSSLRPVHLLIVNGDSIDGRGEKSGSLELVTTDRQDQVDMAEAVIKTMNPRNIIMTYGTAYHTGPYEDYETEIADAVGAKIGSHEWATVNGLTFDIKHHIGSSIVPYGRHTAVARERLWNQLWAEHDEQPRGQVIVRSHVHYFSYAGGPDWLALTTPALQAAGDKYGSRRCSGHVDFGVVSFDVDDHGGYTWRAHLAVPRTVRARAFRY